MIIPHARIHFIVARESPIAAVFRRGPSKTVALLQWNLKNGEITLGQWLRGRIYPMRADLSPNGKHLIYFAANHRPHDALGGSWTAISTMPYLTALHLYGWGHCWNGGGLFVDNASYWLNTGWSFADLVSHDANPAHGPLGGKVQCGLHPSDAPPPGATDQTGEDPVTYLPRLHRDGWREVSRHGDNTAAVVVLEKPVRKGWVLEKTFHMGLKAGQNHECYADTHRLIGKTEKWDLPGVDCADVYKGTLLFARSGALWRQAVHARGPDDETRIADLNDLKFTAIEAPYAGVSAQDLRPWR